jgi:hypothetical protein
MERGGPLTTSRIAAERFVRTSMIRTTTTPFFERLDRIERNQERGQRDSDFFVEAFAVFVQIWMAHTPRLTDADKPSAEQSALQRFREYAEHVVEKIAEGGTLFADHARENVTGGDGGALEPRAKPRGGSR